MKAAILREIGKPLEVREIPAVFGNGTIFENEVRVMYGQVLVKVLCSGICGAQLQEIDGQKGNPAHVPHMLGHEGCGIVLGTGRGVKHVTEGDKVVIHWRKGEGIDTGGGFFDGLGSGPCTTFSEYTIVSENRVTPIPNDVPDDFACLLGCCLSTALGTIENVAKVKPGESVLIIGVGGVGLAMILAVKLAGAQAVTTDTEFSKWNLAKRIGATRFFPAYTEFHWQDFSNHTDHSAQCPEPEPTYDVIIDTVGSMSRTELLSKNGRHVIMTGPNQNTEGGNFNPTRDIPRYVEMWRDGKLNDYGKIITHVIKLDEINKGIQLMRDGKAGRVIIVMR